MFYFIFFLSIIALISLIKTRAGLYLILILLPSYLLRTKIGFVPTTFLELSIYTVFLVWFLKTLGERRLGKKIKRILWLLRPFLIPLVLFFFAALLSTFISPDKKLSLGVLKGWFFDPFLVFVLFLGLVRPKKQARNVILALLIAASWVSLYGLYEYVLGVGLDSDGRLNSVYIPANYVGMFVTSILVLSLIFIKKIKSKFLRITHYSLVITIILALYFSKSYGAWLGLIAALIFLWLQIKLPAKRVKYLLLFALLVIIISLFQSQSVKFGHLFEFTYRTSSASRSEIWRTAVLMIREHPLLGIGLGNFEAVYREYIPQIIFPPLEWLVVKPHNLYLNLWIEMGVLGLISFIWLMLLFFKQGIKSEHRPHFVRHYVLQKPSVSGARLRLTGFRHGGTPSSPDLPLLHRNLEIPMQLDNPLIKYTMAAMIALLAHGLVDTPYFKNDLAVLFWVLVGMIFILSKIKTTPHLSQPAKGRRLKS